MLKIFQEINFPGSSTCPVIIPRNSKRTSSNKKIALQLELSFVDVDHQSSKKE